MGAQIPLLNLGDYQIPGLKKIKKRVRYKEPTYKKFYSFYRYDRTKFRLLLNAQSQFLFGLFYIAIFLKFNKILWLISPICNFVDEKFFEDVTFLDDRLFTQDEILEKCYILDENGEKLKYPDEIHILRIKTLFNIYNRIGLIVYHNFPFDIPDGNYNFEGLTFSMYRLEKMVYIEDGKKLTCDAKVYTDAYITGTEMLSIKQRLKLHIRLLRLLRQGYDVNDAVRKVKGE